MSVGSTKILAIPSTGGRRQLTVYSNAVNTETDNLMCLPVPYPTTVEFETVPADIFTQCEDSFQSVQLRGMPLGVDNMSWGLNSELEIRSHSSYEVVLILSLADMDRVPARFAILTPLVQRFLRRTYGDRRFGFLLCRLNPGAVNYEPFAYSHEIDGHSLFLPTMHFHMHNAGFTSRENIDWDHSIYTMFTPLEVGHRARTKVPLQRNKINWRAMPDRFRHSESVQMHLREIAGKEESNRDIVMPIIIT